MPSLDEPVTLCPYQADWPACFTREQQRLAALALTPSVIEHIGSTAVPGLLAKPTIDLMLGLPDYPPSAKLLAALAALGYESLGEAGVPERHYLRLRGSLSANLHLVLYNGTHWRNNLALRDYLRATPTACLRYAQAKQAAVAGGANLLLSYSAAKGAVVGDLLHQALMRTAGNIAQGE